MPKKTKKEKLLAELRRKSLRPELSSTLQVQPSANNSVPMHSDGQFRFQARVAQPIPTITPKQTNELHAIRRDLLKTLVLSALAFTGELVLYWRWELKP